MASCHNTYGINYEGNKIIQHILKYRSCIGFANIQIAMDAPFEGRVADDKYRSHGRSEKSFGYDEDKLKENIYLIFEFIKIKYLNVNPETKIVLQIARGRSADLMYVEILHDIFVQLNIIDYFQKFYENEKIYNYKKGYKTTDYYIPMDDIPFIFVNIGMFGILTNVETISVGTIFNIGKTLCLNKVNDSFYIENEFIIDCKVHNNILDNFDIFKKVNLLSLNDDMPFVTPNDYKEHDLKKLIY
jgi:hypothetical protein